MQLSEWGRPGWTYHAKGLHTVSGTADNTQSGLGLWLTPAESGLPNATVFGSTNLSSRSANLDTELSFTLLTANDKLKQQFRDELAAIRKFSDIVDEGTWDAPSRRIRLSTRLLVAVVQNML